MGRGITVSRRVPKLGRQLPSTRLEEFRIGDRVEFLSGIGCWKPGIVVEIANSHLPTVLGDSKCRRNTRFVRMTVGNGVFLIRGRERVRYAQPS